VDSSIADRFTTELWRVLGAALEAPERAPADPAGKRRVRLRDFPHVVIYHWEPPVLRVLAVAHGSRDPDYWSDRS
jgi:hypothetical protein